MPSSTHSRSRSSSISSVASDPTTLSTAFLPPRDQKAAGTTSLSFNNLLSPPLILKEDLKEGCGGQTWPAGMVLAEWILSDSKKCGRLEECREAECIVELGAGGGLVGLAVALGLRQSQSQTQSQMSESKEGEEMETTIYITDQDVLIPLIEENITLNHLDSNTTTPSSKKITTLPLTLNWGDPLPRMPKKPTLILAADCVYFEPAFPLLLSTLHDLLDGNPDAKCWFVYKKRRKADLRFVKELRKGFGVEVIRPGGEVEGGKERVGWEREGIMVLEVRGKK